MSINPCSGSTHAINTGGSTDDVHIVKAEGLLGLMGCYRVDINGQTQYMDARQIESAALKLGVGDGQASAEADLGGRDFLTWQRGH